MTRSRSLFLVVVVGFPLFYLAAYGGLSIFEDRATEALEAPDAPLEEPASQRAALEPTEARDRAELDSLPAVPSSPFLQRQEPVPPPVPDDEVGLQREAYGEEVPRHLVADVDNFATQYSLAFSILDETRVAEFNEHATALPPELQADPTIPTLAIAALEGRTFGEALEPVSEGELRRFYSSNAGVREDYAAIQATRTAEVLIFALEEASPAQRKAVVRYLEEVEPRLARAFPHSASEALAVLAERRRQLGRRVWQAADRAFPASGLELRFWLRTELQ